MISRTKYEIDNQTIEKLFEAAGIHGVTDIMPLGAGEFNAVYSARANGIEYAIKIAPAEDVPVLTYEKNMLEAEIFWYQQMREHTSIAVPQVYYSDFSKTLIPTSYFIMEQLPGKQLDEMELNEAEKAESAAELAKMGAQLHTIKNDKFGYVQNGLYDDWYQAIRSMVQAVINDCMAIGEKTENGEKLLSYLDKHKSVLEKAECSMCNFDIWAPNIICKRENGELKYAWIDPERSFWGDRIMDFICFEMMSPLAEKKASLAAYNAVADQPVTVTEEEKIRYAVALGYMAIIMEVERYFRYAPGMEGWQRNMFASDMLYKQAFAVLENS